MAFRTDGRGLAFKCDDLKLSNTASTWASKLSQLEKQSGMVRIVTYSLPDVDYVKKQLARRPWDISMIVHINLEKTAQIIKEAFPRIRMAVHPGIHSKILMIEPRTVWVSNANFGNSRWQETSLGMHHAGALAYYTLNMFKPLWQQSRELIQPIYQSL